MGRPTQLPIFATGDVFGVTAPPLLVGAPNKLAPPGGVVSEGFDPNTRLGAQYLNYLKNLTGQWIAYLANIKVANWLQSAPRAAAAFAIRGIVYDSVHDSWIMVGDSGITARGLGAWGSMPGGSGWIVQTGALGAIDMKAIAVLAGNAVCVGLGGASYLSPDGGFGWTSHTIGGGVPDMFAVAADTAHSLFVAGGTALYTSPDGITWTSRVAASGTLQFNSICVNPAGIGIAVGTGVGFGTSAIYRSTDSITWTAQASGTVVAYKGVAWDSVSSLFVAVGASGTVNTSPDGISWTPHIALGGVALGCVATDGGHWIVGLPNVSGRGGLAFSYDQGATWGKVGFVGDGNTGGFSQTATCIAHGAGAFHATTDGGVVLRSMRVQIEPTAV